MKPDVKDRALWYAISLEFALRNLPLDPPVENPTLVPLAIAHRGKLRTYYRLKPLLWIRNDLAHAKHKSTEQDWWPAEVEFLRGIHDIFRCPECPAKVRIALLRSFKRGHEDRKGTRSTPTESVGEEPSAQNLVNTLPKAAAIIPRLRPREPRKMSARDRLELIKTRARETGAATFDDE